MFYLNFEEPLYLFFLFVIPILIFVHFYLLKHSKEKALRFANFESLEGAAGDKTITKNIWILILRITILCCVIVGASGLVLWHETDVSENDFVIAIDISPSMSASDIKPRRIEVAKGISEWLVNKSEHANIGVVSFSGITFIDSTMITNKNSLRKTINNIRVKKVGGTDISGVIITSANMLQESDKSKVIFLIGDGSDTASAFLEESIEQSVEYAISNQIIINTIGIGSVEGPAGYLPEEYNLSTVYNGDILMEISNSTNGEFFSVSSVNEFKEQYDMANMGTEKGMVPIKLGKNFIIVALILLFVEWVLMNTWFRKVP